MKKVLLAGTAVLGIALAATPAAAELNLDLGGLFRGYAVHTDNDETGGATDSVREFDFRRDAEIHFTGETTLDNGLTVGFHAETNLGGVLADTDEDTFADAAEVFSSQTDEVYAYFSGGWGRVNFGSEDGAAYLLQVAAPSADSNVDGLRTYIQSYFRETALPATAAGLLDNGVLDYDHADFRNTDRITYLTPKFSGFQAGVSFAPEDNQNVIGNNVAPGEQDDDVGDHEDLWEVAARWDGEFSGFGLSLGAGYSSADLETDGVLLGENSDGLDTWNVGGNVAFNSFSIGAAFKSAETSRVASVGPVVSSDVEQDTWVVGGAWDNGPYHLGVSYLNQQTESSGAGAFDFEADRTTIGGGYTFGPGMTFRGAVAFGEYDTGAAATSNDFQQITVGTDIQF